MEWKVYVNSQDADRFRNAIHIFPPILNGRYSDFKTAQSQTYGEEKQLEENYACLFHCSKHMAENVSSLPTESTSNSLIWNKISMI